MSKPPSPKADQLRALREAKAERLKASKPRPTTKAAKRKGKKK